MTDNHTPDLDEAGLLPCPFCGSDDVMTSPEDDFPDYDGDYAVVAVCADCGARGPSDDCKGGLQAFAAWNRRATTVGEPVASPSDDLIAFCITETLGERCDDFDADCHTCQAWAQYDAHPSSDIDPVREAAQALMDDVNRRYPGEELYCPYMRRLNAALNEGGGDNGS